MNIHFPYGRARGPLLIILAAFAAGIGLWLGGGLLRAPVLPEPETAALFPQPRPVTGFTLTSANGSPLTLEDWKGRWTVVFFGFTHCPDICPVTLAALRDAKRQLPAEAAGRVHFQFISVDPGRDTPAHLGRYAAFFDPEFGAATGTHDELTRLTRSLGLVYTIGEPEDGTYEVDHSAAAVIIDPQGREVGLFRPPLDPAAMARDLARLVETG